jgi:hypothetical protein
MKIQLKGKHSLQLNQNNFIAKGGEGEIYGKGSLIYKIYLDPKKMISLAKIKELNEIKEKNVLKPKDIVLSQKNNPIGFTMDWVKDTYPLCKLFTNAFRNKNNIIPETINELIENMRDTIFKIHESQCLIVDGNEFNYLVDNTFKTPYFIDVDSYQTRSFPATAIMPSIVDYHTKKFSKLSDWYSFAIVSCQLFVGIHPFKGTHSNYKKRDLEKRMRDNVSIFNKETALPPSVRSFDLIPNNWQDWFINLFEKGVRELPPTSMKELIKVAVKKTIIKSTDNLIIRLIKEFESKILYYKNIGFDTLIKTKKDIYINKYTFLSQVDTELIMIEKNNTPVLFKIEHNNLVTKYRNFIISHNIKCQKKLIIDNQLFIINGNKFSHIIIKEVNNNLLLGIGKTWNIMENSKEVFGNIIFQSILGKSFLFIPLNEKICINIQIPELEDCKIINMKYIDKVCIGVFFKDNEYKRFTIIFNEDHIKYSYSEIETDFYDVNFTVLPNGITISIIDEHKMQIFTNNYIKNKIKEITNNIITTDMILCNDQMQVQFFKDNLLYSMKMT